MKKWFVLALIACVAVAARAGEGEGKKNNDGAGQGKEVSKEQFIAKQKKMAEKKGVEYDAAKAEARFTKMDKDKDGKLTGEEVPQKGKGKGKGEGKGE